MSTPQTWHLVCEPTGPAGAFLLDEQQLSALGAGKTSPVTVTVGERTSRVRIASMGGSLMIGLSKAVRAELGVELGEAYDVTIAVDDAPREVSVPDELAVAFAATPEAEKRYADLSPSQRKACSRWVGGAAQQSTRDRRAQQAVAKLLAGESF